MAENETTVTLRDPWPSPEPAWYDPPWLMRGRSATAWFQAPWEVVEQVMSPDLLPEAAPTVRARLRFYDLEFEAVGGASGQPLIPRIGRFKEGVVAFAARGGGLEGEVSLFLWSDSETYLMWGREVFGWPVRPAEVDLNGSLWTNSDLDDATGDCRLRDHSGEAAVRDVKITGRASAGTPSGHWLTPRRVLHGAGKDGETRELLVVHPVVNKPGEQFAASGTVGFDFPEPHPLHLLDEIDADVEVADGFELSIGAKVDVVSSSRIQPDAVGERQG